MKKWKHINFEQRKTIASGISHNMKVKDLGILLNLHPTGISREVKRNRSLVEPTKNNKEMCLKLNRWPYVCTNCKKRYLDCSFNKYIYNAKNAQNNADYILKSSRNGLDVNNEEMKLIDNIIKVGVDNNNKSIYQIKIENRFIIFLYRIFMTSLLFM